jgi:hypothetical protein
MAADSSPDSRRLTSRLTWLPVVVYIIVKYVIYRGDMSGRGNLLLLGFVVAAEIALYLYGRHLRKREETTPDRYATYPPRQARYWGLSPYDSRVLRRLFRE